MFILIAIFGNIRAPVGSFRFIYQQSISLHRQLPGERKIPLRKSNSSQKFELMSPYGVLLSLLGKISLSTATLAHTKASPIHDDNLKRAEEEKNEAKKKFTYTYVLYLYKTTTHFTRFVNFIVFHSSERNKLQSSRGYTLHNEVYTQTRRINEVEKKTTNRHIISQFIN